MQRLGERAPSSTATHPATEAPRFSSTVPASSLLPAASAVAHRYTGMKPSAENARSKAWAGSSHEKRFASSTGQAKRCSGISGRRAGSGDTRLATITFFTTRTWGSAMRTVPVIVPVGQRSIVWTDSVPAAPASRISDRAQYPGISIDSSQRDPAGKLATTGAPPSMRIDAARLPSAALDCSRGEPEMD